MAGWLTALDRLAHGRAKAGLIRTLRPRAAGDPVVDLAGNDYLGLATHPEVVAATIKAVSSYGLGATGSRLVRGSTEAHALLEADLADWLGAGQALVFSSGYLANLAAVRALATTAGPGALITSGRGSATPVAPGAAARYARSPSPRTP